MMADFRYHVLRAIAARHDAGGATPDALRETVEYYEHIRADASHLDEAIRRLLEAGYVEKAGDGYRLSDELALRLPRSPTGRVDLNRARWDAFAERLAVPFVDNTVPAHASL